MTTQINGYNCPDGTLTTDHAASSHGIPVLVIGGEAYGPTDDIQCAREDGRQYMQPAGLLVASRRETLGGRGADGRALVDAYLAGTRWDCV